MPVPGPGPVLVEIKASSICRSDIRAIEREHLGTGDEADRIREATGGKGSEASVDCSGVPAARTLALQGTRHWGRCAFCRSGHDVRIDVSPLRIHPQITLFGSWVTSLTHIAELTERLARWGLHPETTVTNQYALDAAAEAYRIADEGNSVKVVITMA